MSGWPRWSRSGASPAAPIAVSVWPVRHGRPMVSVMITPTLTPRRSPSALRSRRAEPSGSSGSSTTVPGAVLELSTPAAASTRPCLVSTIRVGPRRATTRTVSASMACSRSARTTRPSALLTIFEVTTRMSPSAQVGQRRRRSAAARSAPGSISGRPGHAGDRERRLIGSAPRPGRAPPGRSAAVGGQVGHVERERPDRDPGQLRVVGRGLVLVVDQPAVEQAGAVVRGDRRRRWSRRRSRSGTRRPCRAPARRR